MKIIICVDDNSGMLFNNRRQSQDKAIIKKISELTKGHKLWIRNFSRNLFKGNITVDEDMLMKAEADDFCFVEDVSVMEYADRVDTVYIFKWNRVYPADIKLDIDVEKLFHLESTEVFTGNSHEKITLERWLK